MPDEESRPRVGPGGPAGLAHRVQLPGVEGLRPAVIMLHGRSGDEDVMWVFARALPPDWVVVAPRGLHPDPGGGYAWHPRRPDEWPALSMFDDAADAVAGFARALPEIYPVEPQAVYWMGFSQGAATAYALALRHPDLARGIAGLVGFMPEAHADVVRPAPLRGLPVFMAAGRQDPAIPMAVSQACARALRLAGADLDFREYDTGHKLDAQGMRDLTAWWRAIEERDCP